jgi:hypothetical protein
MQRTIFRADLGPIFVNRPPTVPTKHHASHVMAARAERSACSFDPTGKSPNPVQPPLQKYSASRLPQIKSISPAVPFPLRDVSRSSKTLGAGCGGRGWRQGRTALTRTEKSCGPGAPTLVSSSRKDTAQRRWQKSPVTGESTKETVKTIARGMPGDFRCDRGD